LGRCRRRAEGGGERACCDGDLEHRNLPFETCGKHPLCRRYSPGATQARRGQ
jgi:hypothetical protein